MSTTNFWVKDADDEEVSDEIFEIMNSQRFDFFATGVLAACSAIDDSIVIMNNLLKEAKDSNQKTKIEFFNGAIEQLTEIERRVRLCGGIEAVMMLEREAREREKNNEGEE